MASWPRKRREKVQGEIKAKKFKRGQPQRTITREGIAFLVCLQCGAHCSRCVY